MTSELDLDKIRRSAEPGAMFGAIIVRDLVDRLEQAEQAVARVREVVGEDAPSFFTNEAMHAYDKAMSEITRALEGDGRG